MRFSLTSALLLATSAYAAVPSLTPDNYDELTTGKTVFIKFFAPWCGHCKKMAPDWEKLADQWADSKVGLIAEVDCTTDGKPLCDANGVKGFPTLKWGDPASLEEYSGGGRDFSSMEKFANENLKPVCSVTNFELCSDEKKEQITKFQAMSASDLEAAIKTEEGKMEEAEEAFKKAVEELQSTYQKLMQEKDEKLAEVKGAGLGLMKAVSAHAAKKGSDEL